MNKSLNNFTETIRQNPTEIMNPKYNYMSNMFPHEYIEGMKIYIKYLLNEISKKEYDLQIHRIRSKL